MKTNIQSLFIGLALIAGVYRAAAQLPVITSFSQNGVLVCSNLNPGSTCTVQWASSLAGSWSNLYTLTVASNRSIVASVPMFYRVLEVSSTNAATTNAPAGMALIPAGTFTMGDSLDGESDALPTNIYVSAFYMDVNLVSYGQWTNVYAYATSHGYNFVYAFSGKNSATNQPVQTVDWFDCVKWCNARSQQAGLTPVYYTDAGFTQVFTNGDNGTTIYQNLTTNGYRLPTEAEWEKAARAGRNGLRFPWGNTIQNGQAQYVPNPSVYSFDLGTYNDTPIIPATVGSFPANGYGLYDMAGNMFEWCWDWYGTPYGMPTTTDPTGATSGSSRILRGGGWGSGPNVARCANRYSHAPTVTHACYGFRCVRAF
jgi:formylglycine-generating enzyme required for sulfatase activity